MLFPFGDHREGRQIAIVVQQQMQLHRSFGQAKLGPIKHGGAEIDDRGVQAQQGILESELPLLPRSWLAGRQDLALRQQLLKDRLLQLPRPMFVGVGQRGASRSRWQTQVPKFSFTRGQASADFTQDRKSTRLNSSHQIISYAVFCLKKKKKRIRNYDACSVYSNVF